MNQRGDSKRYWEKASASWGTFGSPLRPCGPDLASIAAAVDGWPGRRGGPRVLLMGVTPEYYRFWPDGTDVLAVDKSPVMIETVWPGPPEAVRCDNWLTMDLPAASRDIALCDGGFPLLIPPGDQAGLAENLRRIIAESGRVILRSFILPCARETFEQVLEDLRAGRIGSANALKVRLWTSLADDPRQGIRLADVWNALARAVPDLDTMSRQLGWPLEGLRQIASYRDSDDHYYFLTVEEITRIFCEEVGGFRYVDSRYPEYELGERCPVIVFERMGAG